MAKHIHVTYYNCRTAGSAQLRVFPPPYLQLRQPVQGRAAESCTSSALLVNSLPWTHMNTTHVSHIIDGVIVDSTNYIYLRTSVDWDRLYIKGCKNETCPLSEWWKSIKKSIPRMLPIIIDILCRRQKMALGWHFEYVECNNSSGLHSCFAL
jgi:hypothetical protein